MSNEPAVTIAAVLAAVQAVLVLVVAFGVDLTEAQSEAILGAVGAVGTLIAGVLIRRKVTPSA